MENNDLKFFVETLKSGECQCENTKKPGFSFCFRCYKRLPGELANALYRGIGAGYEQAYEEAFRYLNDL
jgi:hypothetical protein